MIKEDFLHYIWKYKLLKNTELELTNGEKVVILNYGTYNPYAGPDFFNARLIINGQEWAGNVEIHTKSSLWYVHHHEKDPLYGNVILHIVWKHDVEVFDCQQNYIPTLELQNFVDENLIQRYLTLKNADKNFIPCEKQIFNVDTQTINAYLNELYIERLEEKSLKIIEKLTQTNNDWEEVFFQLLMHYFGGNINGESFEKMAKNVTFSVVRKELHHIEMIEALFFGQLQLIPKEKWDIYTQELHKNYIYLQHKYQLSSIDIPIQFTQLRPPNFPTIRIAQIAQLYHTHQALFSKCISINSIYEFYTIFENIKTSPFWENHYTFSKESSKISKKISKKLVELLWINVIIPIQYTYNKVAGKELNEEYIKKIIPILAEDNSVTERFAKMGIIAQNAMQSQSILQLYNIYCTQKKCLQCNIGIYLLNK